MQVPARPPLPLPSLHGLLSRTPLLLAPVPLALLQPIFDHIAAHVARTRPELFARLGAHVRKRFLVDPIDFPFVLVLTPDADHPSLQAFRRHDNPPHDGAIAGTFLNLMDMIDGTLDGDALFFSRDLRVSGDTEAVVALRNALDDFDGNVLDSIVSTFGLLSAPAALALSMVRSMRGKQRHER